MQDQKTVESIRDLTTAAALVCLGHRVTGIVLQKEGSSDRNRGYFQFIDTEELRNSLELIQAGGARVEPNAFHKAIKTLKSRVEGKERAPRR